MVSIPAMTIRAVKKDLKPSIGRVTRLMARWSCSMMLLRYLQGLLTRSSTHIGFLLITGFDIRVS